MNRILRAATWLLLAGAGAGPLGATIPTDPEALTEEIRRCLPERVVVDRLVTTPHHVLLGGHAPAFGDVADLLDSLPRTPWNEELRLRRVERSERGFDFSVTVPPAPAETRDEPPSRPEEESFEPGSTVGLVDDGLDDLAIHEIAVREIYRTSVGGVARIEARGRPFLIRKGDRLADGDVGEIEFFTSQIAWVKLRRRVTGDPGAPYRPVVWILSSDAPRAAREDQIPGPAIGPRWNRRIEAQVLTAQPTGRNALPPWSWVLTVEEAPRFFVALLQGLRPEADAFETLDGLGPPLGEGWLSISFGSLGFEIPFTSRESIARAVADELGVPVPPPSFRLKDDPSKQDEPSGEVVDLDEILRAEDEVLGLYEVPLYDLGGRRDPFHDLTGFPEPIGGPRPEGVAGLLIDDIEVEAVFETPKGLLAEVCTRRRCYFVREGTDLYDGEVARIDLGHGVLFNQALRDPIPGREPEIEASYDSEGRRDPFGSLSKNDARPALLPSALSKLTCETLTQGVEAESLGDLLERAESRLAVYRWERGLAETHLEDGEPEDGEPEDGEPEDGEPEDGEPMGVQDYLEDIAQTAAFDLARLLGRDPLGRDPYFGKRPPLESILEVERPSPVEMFSLLGDLELLAGRPRAAAEAYRRAQSLSPDYEPLCGRLHDGKLYGVEELEQALRKAAIQDPTQPWHPF